MKRKCKRFSKETEDGKC